MTQKIFIKRCFLNHLKFLILIVLFFSFLIGCASTSANDQSELNKYILIYSKWDFNKTLWKFNFDSNRDNEFHRSLNSSGSLRGISKLNHARLVFGDCPHLDNKCYLKIINYQTMSWEVWGEGFLPTYFEDYNILAYYIENKDSGNQELVASNIGEPKEVLFKAKTKIPEDDSLFFNLDPNILNIEGEGILFLGVDEELKILRLDSKVISKTGIRRCSPKFWRNKSKKLYCRNWDDGNILEIDLGNPKSKKDVNIPNFKGVIKRVVYDGDLDILIFSTINTNFLLNEVEKFRLYSYSFQSERTVKLKDGGLGEGLLLPRSNFNKVHD